ncbi:tetratricopeptide repeat protein [[Limnothrix rosea] IAM M-220]|uniref:tetratricopeptide repeat protein n=1 Tax=[Limnothrix rosea] IAM M-220 TaxID=454133 RepID=UPI000963F4E5|nr:tetratricopeptide repeat protein [[Limnothrix rosea] IAM M-220]OKH13435.1 hypothetical protein NIES208_14980 [[Limnothrix rosea] IAM M-220]
MSESQGKYEAAEPLFIDALQMTKELLGDRHPSVATSLHNLGTLYYQQSKYSQAQEFISQAVEILLPVVGEQHPNVQISLWYLDQIQQAILEQDS